MGREITYLLGWDHDSNLLASFGELIWLDSSIVIQIKVFEGFKKNGFLILNSVRLLRQFGLETLLETIAKRIRS